MGSLYVDPDDARLARAPWNVLDVERQLQRAGRDVVRTFEGGPTDGWWWFVLDGRVVAHAASIGELERQLRGWIFESSGS